MIGVFDSGHGGLTVLRALIGRMPQQDFIYLGDHAHAPYGERSAEDVYGLTVEKVTRLFGLGCDLVLLACNTASAVALRRLQQEWLPDAHPNRRVLGVFVPMVEAITNVPWQIDGPCPAVLPEARTVGVFATRRTVESGAYAREIAKRAPGVQVVQQACPGLVDLIEDSAADTVIQPAIQGFAAALRERMAGGFPDCVILGCTHYPLVARHFTAALPAAVRVLDQPEVVAKSLAHYLVRHPRFGGSGGHNGAVAFYTTGSPGRISALASRFFGQRVRFRDLPPDPTTASLEPALSGGS
jgi:glutamate racemase